MRSRSGDETNTQWEKCCSPYNYTVCVETGDRGRPGNGAEKAWEWGRKGLGMGQERPGNGAEKAWNGAEKAWEWGRKGLGMRLFLLIKVE